MHVLAEEWAIRLVVLVPWHDDGLVEVVEFDLPVASEQPLADLDVVVHNDAVVVAVQPRQSFRHGECHGEFLGRREVIAGPDVAVAASGVDLLGIGKVVIFNECTFNGVRTLHQDGRPAMSVNVGGPIGRSGAFHAQCLDVDLCELFGIKFVFGAVPLVLEDHVGNDFATVEQIYDGPRRPVIAPSKVMGCLLFATVGPTHGPFVKGIAGGTGCVGGVGTATPIGRWPIQIGEVIVLGLDAVPAVNVGQVVRTLIVVPGSVIGSDDTTEHGVGVRIQGGGCVGAGTGASVGGFGSAVPQPAVVGPSPSALVDVCTGLGDGVAELFPHPTVVFELGPIAAGRRRQSPSF